MVLLSQFKKMIGSLDENILADLCEQFVYDHEAALKATLELTTNFGMNVDSSQVKQFITEMHPNGDFDDVECWGLKLGTNDLYKKFHP